MHQPATFIETDPAKLQALVANHPLATLVAETSTGVVVNHVPLLWKGNELLGHVARANELVAALGQEPQKHKATAIFHGPEGYVSPADYPSKLTTGKVVPTWNYAVVHIRGVLQLRDDPDWILNQVSELTAAQEHNSEEPWTLSDAPAAYAETVLRGIVGISLEINRVQGKFKLSQNRQDADRQGATDGVRSRGNKQLANLMNTP